MDLIELDLPFDWSTQWPGYIGAFFVAFVVTFIMTPVCRTIALRFNIVDKPDPRKIHTTPIPRMAGVGFYFALLASLLTVLFLFPALWRFQYVGLVWGAFFVVLLGVADDIIGLSASIKLVFQICVGYIAYRSGFKIETLTNPFGGQLDLSWLSGILSIVWFVGLMNALNLIDGLDGLSSGVVFIASFGMLAITFTDSDPVICLFSFILMGITLAFLRYNFYPAQIFMGDSGSLLLGYLIAAVSILGQRKGVTAITLLIPLIALGLPILDTAMAIIRRGFSGKHLFQSDKEHLHHRLLAVGLSHRQAVLLIYLMCIYLSLTAFILSKIPQSYTLILLLVLAIGFFIGLEVLKFIEEKVKENISLKLDRTSSRKKS